MATTRFFEEGQGWVEIDGYPFPLAENTPIVRNPLYPFSPALVGGASSKVTDSRLSVQVWTDFTGGIGQRKQDQPETTSYSEGNLDTRVPGAVALPPVQTLLGTGSFTSVDGPANIEFMGYVGGTPALFIYSKTFNKAQVFRSGIFTSRPAEYVMGFASFQTAYWYVTNTAGTSKVYFSTDQGNTWTVSYTYAGGLWGLVHHDNRLITYNATLNRFEQSFDGVTWTQYSPGPSLVYGESIRELIAWLAPSGVRDTVYALSNKRILVFEEEATEWHPFYDFNGIFSPTRPNAHVWRRDGNLYFAPYDDSLTSSTPDESGIVMLFTPGTSDEVGPTKREGFPETYLEGVFRMQGGAHWLYGWCYGAPGGLFSFNEFQGWTWLFDPRIINSARKCIGGGYGSGKAWTLLDNGALYECRLKDRRATPPISGVSYPTQQHYLRSAWSSHNQDTRDKIAAYVEIDLIRADGKSGVEVGDTCSLEFWCRSEDGVWQQFGGTLLPNSYTQWPIRIPIQSTAPVETNPTQGQVGKVYKRFQWEVRMTRGSTAGWTPVLASVALYYTYWNANHYAYQFTIDLSPERWARDWPDMYIGPYNRDELVEILLGFNEAKQYRTFRFASGASQESVTAIDLLVNGREDANLGGGIFQCTARDVSATGLVLAEN